MTPQTEETAGLVSIGIPVYNGGRYLPRVLAALQAQTYPSIEILISDNASEDNSVEICRGFAQKDPRIRMYQNETNVGPYENFRILMRKARGEFFMWAACDDMWKPGFVQALVEALRAHPDAVVAQSGVQRRTRNGDDRGTFLYTGAEDPYRQHRLRLALRAANTQDYVVYMYGLFRRRFLARIFASYVPIVSADRLFIALVALSAKLVAVPDVLHIREVHGDPAAIRDVRKDLDRHLTDGRKRLNTVRLATQAMLECPLLSPAAKLTAPLVMAAFATGLYHHEWKRWKGNWIRRFEFVRDIVIKSR